MATVLVPGTGTYDTSSCLSSIAHRTRRIYQAPLSDLYLKLCYSIMVPLYCRLPDTAVTLVLLHPIYYLRPSVLSLLHVTHIRGHIVGSFSPLTATVRALNFYRKISALSSLVDSRRIASTHAKRSQQSKSPGTVWRCAA